MTAINLGEEVIHFLDTFLQGYTYDPGDSDLDNEQPIHVTATLGDYRLAVFLFTTLVNAHDEHRKHDAH